MFDNTAVTVGKPNDDKKNFMYESKDERKKRQNKQLQTEQLIINGE